MTTTDTHDYLRLLEAIKDSTDAILTHPNSSQVAAWLTYRAGMYRRLAAEHPQSAIAELARDNAALDQARASTITTQGGHTS